jgi:hypothetical protein
LAETTGGSVATSKAGWLVVKATQSVNASIVSGRGEPMVGWEATNRDELGVVAVATGTIMGSGHLVV